jgi:AcrR family transcriptional regulator
MTRGFAASWKSAMTSAKASGSARPSPWGQAEPIRSASASFTAAFTAVKICVQLSAVSPPAQTASQIVIRPLSATQAATRRKLLEAARELAREGGYDAVGMRQVAERAGVSAPTAYQYFSSKDHLLVDAMVERVGTTTEAVRSRPSRARSPLERTVATLRRVMKRVEEEPNLYIAMTRAYISGVPEVAHARSAMESTMREWIDVALGPAELDDRAAVVAILEAVLFAGMVGMVIGGNEPSDIADDLERAARTLLRSPGSGDG